MPEYFDTHCHLDQTEFDGDREAVITRALAVGVASILTVGVTAASSQAAVQLAAQHPGLYAAVGIQPNYAGAAEADDWRQIVELSRQQGVVAVGETGLDRYWDHTPFDVQEDYFDRHLRLSRESGLPVVIHSRECDDDILKMLRAAAERGPLQGIMHSFCSTAEMATECLALGLHISFAGMVTFKKAEALRRVAMTIPDERILIETDAPYLAPHPRRGKRNEPALVACTAACLAEARGQTLDDLAELTTANARRLFKLPA